MTDNEATRTTFVRTKPALREDETEAENKQAENKQYFGVEARLASRT